MIPGREINRYKDPTVKSETSRKRSAEDKEIEEWAKKLMTRTAPQIPIQGQNSTLNQPDISQHSGFDIDSAIGRFTWQSIGEDKFIPCLFRNGVKYCCIRMVEASVMGDLLTVLPQEIYDSAKLCSHFATAVEARLLTYINSWHCDGFYGNDPFTERDLVATLQEVEELHAYLVFAYNILSSGGHNKDGNFTRCGFVRVNNESLIPYTLLRSEPDGEKGVPLFYFEGQTDILKVKAKPLTGWDLAYLKVCCKVQGVRKELIAGDTLNIVKLSDLKSYFPKRTVFTEQCWPPSKGKSLLPKQSLNGVSGSSTVQTHIQNMPGQPARNPLQTPNERIIATSMSSTTPTTVVRGPIGLVNGINHAAATNSSVRRDINVNITGVQVNRVNAHNAYGKSPFLQRIKATGQPLDSQRLITIDEVNGGHSPGAYVVSTINFDSKGVHCINYQAFHQEVRMIILPHLIYSLFPTIAVNAGILDLLRQLGLPVYLPNSHQLRVMNQHGFAASRAWELPLISYKDLLPKYNSLRAFLQQFVISQQQQRQNGLMQNSNPMTNNASRVTYQTGLQRR
ncbi:unnamed protein product [Allacma fusca]|uniref:Uncharacterized protein n=1 Tax=Allacma fusca TaxID=39272 RepID=A0A8J2P580_9HEXA|nr:unnamed protein product [Allacma fusca]